MGKENKIKKIIAGVFLGGLGLASSFQAGEHVGKGIGKENAKIEGIEITKDDEGNKDKIIVDGDEYPVVTINSLKEAEITSFEERIKVNPENLKELVGFFENKEELEKNTRSEIESLNGSSEILGYIKQMYVDDYNAKNNTNYDKSFVVMTKDQFSYYLKEMESNGQKILVQLTTEGEPTEDEVYNIKIDRHQKSNFAWDKKQKRYRNVYPFTGIEDAKDEVKPIEEAMARGFEYSLSGHGEDEKEKFIEAVVAYKESRIVEIVKENKSKVEEKETRGEREIGD